MQSDTHSTLDCLSRKVNFARGYHSDDKCQVLQLRPRDPTWAVALKATTFTQTAEVKGKWKELTQSSSAHAGGAVGRTLNWESFGSGSLPGPAADQLHCLRQALQSWLFYLENGGDCLP